MVHASTSHVVQEVIDLQSEDCWLPVVEVFGKLCGSHRVVSCRLSSSVCSATASSGCGDSCSKGKISSSCCSKSGLIFSTATFLGFDDDEVDDVVGGSGLGARGVVGDDVFFVVDAGVLGAVVGVVGVDVVVLPIFLD